MGYDFEVNDSTSVYTTFASKGKQPQNSKTNENDFDFLESVRKLNSSNNQVALKNKTQLEKLMKSTEQLKAEKIKQRNSMKASNGLTWEQTQNKIKEYRDKYLPKRDENNPSWFTDSPYRDYIYVKQKGGIAQFYVDERKYILDNMPQEEREDFEKAMAAYDELYPKTREIAPNGVDITNVKYPEETSIASKEPPEGYQKMYI